jgi:putative flippase GtrA
MIRKLYEKYQDKILYLVFGALTTAVNTGVFWLCAHPLGMDALPSTMIAWLVAVIFAYITNRIWVFCSQARGKAIFREILSFYSGRLLTLAMEEGLLLIFVTWLGLGSTLVKTAAQVAVLVGNYLISKFIIFRKK